MISKTTFDSIIKDNLIKVYGKDAFGYKLSKPYENYYSEGEFEKFINKMRSPEYQHCYDSYIKGKGSELKKQVGRFGELPPKMASVASSSRFCYLALRDGGGALGGVGRVKFEKECRIKGVGGTAPQLDAYIEGGNIYVEAKCHEIFDSHKVEMRGSYWELVLGENNDFGFARIADKGEKFKIPLSYFGLDKNSSMFDVKQLLCHLLGISSQKKVSHAATLAYMFFKPKTDNLQINRELDELFDMLLQEITAIFNSTPIKNFSKKNNIKLIAIVECAKKMDPLTKENMQVAQNGAWTACGG